MISECKAGYFQFEVKQDGLYFNVYPPMDGKNPAKMEDVFSYIDKKKINADVVKLDEAIKTGASTKVCVKVSDETLNPFSEFGDYYINPDGMSVEAIFYPPFVGASFLSFSCLP